MRVSANSDDADYFAIVFRGKIRILLDGVDLRDVIEADDVAGYVVRFARDERGELRKADEETLATERLEGRVEIIGRERSSDDGGADGTP